MTEETPRPGTCPRCGVSVRGAFKFCPACAYRLEPSEIEPLAPPPSRDRWLHALVFAVFGVFVIGAAILGYLLFIPEPPTPEAPRVTPETAARRLTVDMDLNVEGSGFEWFAGGPARIIEIPYWRRPKAKPDDDEEPGNGANVDEEVVEEPLPPPSIRKVQVPPLEVQRFEVTRGMYEEYVHALQADPQELLATFGDEVPWRATRSMQEDEALGYATAYVDEWWRRLREHQKSLGAGDDVPPREDVIPIPVPEAFDRWLIVPPTWVEVTLHGELRLRERDAAPDSREIVENLPITDVSWYDAAAFAAWASRRHGYAVSEALRLPSETEWLRIARGGDLDRRFPWGNDSTLIYACNNLGRWRNGRERPLPVDFSQYSDAEDRVREGDGPGVWAMAGNVREWTLNDPQIDGYMDPETHEPVMNPDKRVEKDFLSAPILGGSFEKSLQDCTVDEGSIRYRKKWMRFADVGFRLVSSAFPYGG